MRQNKQGKRFVIFFSVVLLVVAVFSFPSHAGMPTEQVRVTTNKIIDIVSDERLKDASRARERRSLIRGAVNECFDWEEMSRRSLGRHWRMRTQEERRTFINLFGDLLERTYLDKVEGYSGEQVVYVGETIDADYAAVQVKILTQHNTEIPVLYRMKRKSERWMVYDILIEGVSLVNNYRTQFESILARSSFDELIEKLKQKISDN